MTSPTLEYLERSDLLRRIAAQHTPTIERKFAHDTEKEHIVLPEIFAFYKDGIKIGEIDFSTETFVIKTHTKHFEPYALRIKEAFDKEHKKYSL
ncbi:hypothetical protein HY484_03030 [Candidatus Woesearchaeota archaeon]|nr:hypothetical protein [Candidatus Woesearchaeota archaeon]